MNCWNFLGGTGTLARVHLRPAVGLAALAISLFMFAPPSSAQELSGRIERILRDPCMAKADYCVIAKKLAGEIFYSEGGGKLLVPASNMKIITSSAALEILKPSFKFDTLFLHTGVRRAEVINGDLLIIGKGDPHLVSEDMWVMANEFRKMGIRRITGDMLLDEEYFDDRRFHPSWKLSAYRRAFEAPTGALSLNFNSVTIAVYPSAVVGEKPVAAIGQQTPYFNLVNNLRSVAGRSAIRIDLKPRPDGGETVILSGRVMAGSKEKTYYRSVADPALHFGLTFREFLKNAGVTLDGKIIRASSAGKQLREIYVHSSRPLSEQVSYMNKFSNNFMAEQIVKTIGAEVDGVPGSFEKGIFQIEEFLKRLGFEEESFKIVDGSGLSAENRVSCALIVELLEHLRGAWDSGPEFTASLALMGKDGSVKDRLKDSGKTIRVKTGSLNSVSSLSGYYPLVSGDTLVFSMIMNNLSCGNGDAWALQDRLIQEFGKINPAKD